MQSEGSSPWEAGDYVLDSYAVISYLQAEQGSSRIRELLTKAAQGRYRLYFCVVNLGEVLYIVEREMGSMKAQEMLATVEELPIEIVDADYKLTLTAAHLKANCPIAFADCFAAALAKAKDARLITGDPEFHKLKPEYGVKVEWLT
jgi:predicted nucleic acid-binding protein